MKQEIRKQTFDFSVSIIKHLKAYKSDYIHYEVSKQLVRSSTSIGANLAEATAARSRKDFINFYHISLKSTYETLYWLNLLKATSESQDQVTPLIEEATNIRNIVTRSILSLKQKTK